MKKGLVCWLQYIIQYSIINQLNVFNPKYVIGLINSKLMNWYHVVKFYTVRIPEGSLKYPIPFINSIPIRKLKYSKQKVIPEIPHQILTT